MLALQKSLAFFLVFLNICLSDPVSGRVLLRPSNSAAIRGITDTTINTNTIFKNDSEYLAHTNTSKRHSSTDDLFPVFAPNHLYGRAGKQPSAATDAELGESAAKGCSMLYMLAANADDALTRMKLNPKLKTLQSSQSKWDDAGALKQYGWTEKKDPVNWALMEVNDVMKDLEIDTDSKDNMNIRLMQDTEVEVDGTKFAVGQLPFEWVSAEHKRD